MLRPILQNRLRRALIAAIEENVARLVLMIDEQLVSLANRTITSVSGGKTTAETLPIQQTTVPNAGGFNWTTSQTRRDL